MPINNQWYTEAFRDGMYAVYESRETVNARAAALPVAEGDAFLAGYYSERRKLRHHDEQIARALVKILDTPRYRADMIAAGRGRLLR